MNKMIKPNVIIWVGHHISVTNWTDQCTGYYYAYVTIGDNWVETYNAKYDETNWCWCDIKDAVTCFAALVKEVRRDRT